MNPTSRLPLLAVTASFALAPIAPANVAYVVPAGTAGTQNFPGGLGLDFDVNSPIAVSALGVFDDSSGADPGIETSLTVQLWSRNNGGTPNVPSDDTGDAILGTVVFDAAAQGTLNGGSRFQPFSLTLAPGSYTIVSYGHNDTDLNGNVGAGGAPGPWTTDDGGGLISFVGGGRFGSPSGGDVGVFPSNPDGGPANRYAAGTFEFVPEPTTASLLCLGLGLAGGCLRRRK